MKKLLLILLLCPILLNANDLEPHKKVCSDIGFTAGTEDFAECVMDFFKKEKGIEQQSANNSSSNSNSNSSLATQNKLLKEQFEYQKKRDEKEDFRRRMDAFGNFLDSLTGSGKYYQPTQYCRNYGTAKHPNVVCTNR